MSARRAAAPPRTRSRIAGPAAADVSPDAGSGTFASASSLAAAPTSSQFVPGGVAHDPGRRAILLSDTRSGAIHAISPASQRVFARLPRVPGQRGEAAAALVVGADGSIWITRPGGGRDGALFRITPSANVVELPLSNQTAIRSAVAIDDAAGIVFTAAHAGTEGWVSAHALDGEVERVYPGFQHPVGLARVGHALLVADRRAASVFILDLRWSVPVKVRLHEQLPGLISLTRADDLSALATSHDPATNLGQVHRLWLDGRQQLVARGSWEPRGAATDGTRVFLSTRDASKLTVLPALSPLLEMPTLESVLHSLEQSRVSRVSPPPAPLTLDPDRTEPLPRLVGHRTRTGKLQRFADVRDGM